MGSIPLPLPGPEVVVLVVFNDTVLLLLLALARDLGWLLEESESAAVLDLPDRESPSEPDGCANTSWYSSWSNCSEVMRCVMCRVPLVQCRQNASSERGRHLVRDGGMGAGVWYLVSQHAAFPSLPGSCTKKKKGDMAEGRRRYGRKGRGKDTRRSQ